MKKEIKIKLNKFDNKNPKIFFPLRVLIENFNIKFVENKDKSDIIFEMTSRKGKDYRLLKENKKIIIITEEDMFIKRNIFSLIESLISKIGFKNNKYKITDRLDKIIPYKIASIPILNFNPKYLNFVKKIIKGEKNKYAIIQNNIKNKNIFILPVFIQEQYNKLKDLIKEKKSNSDFTKKNFCAFVVSSNSSRERVQFFKKLSKYKKIDSYGKVLNNIKEPLIKDWHDNAEIFKKYKFVICFENNFSKEYITEKLVNVMLSGAIPIYKGAPNIGDYFNTKSFINYDDYGSYDKMIEKIIELDQNEKKYKIFLKEPWFKKNKIPEIIKNKEKQLILFYEKILTK